MALALIGRRDVLTAEVARVTEELAELNREAEARKKNLVAFQGEVARLREEKVRMLAKLANAKARPRLQETIKGLHPMPTSVPSRRSARTSSAWSPRRR